MDKAHQYLAVSLRTPDDVVDDEMNGMLFVRVLMFHVDGIQFSNACCQQYHLSPLQQGRPVHPLDESQGLSWPFTVKPRDLSPNAMTSSVSVWVSPEAAGQVPRSLSRGLPGCHRGGLQ